MLAWIVAVLVRIVTPVPMSVPATAVIVGVTLSARGGTVSSAFIRRSAPPSWIPLKR